MNTRQTRILVLSDMPVEARQIVSLLADDFPQVSCSSDEGHFAADFDAQRPEVLLLAFRHIEHAERHALVLYRHSRRSRPCARTNTRARRRSPACCASWRSPTRAWSPTGAATSRTPAHA